MATWDVGLAGARQAREKAFAPEDLGRMFIERANAGDVDGLVALYEPDAVLAFPPGKITAGSREIRKVYEELLAGRPTFTSEGQQPALVNGDIALTSTRLPGGRATAEVARRQPDGTWLWAIDQPNVLGS
jgi:ketosteroid isomerase-like protein